MAVCNLVFPTAEQKLTTLRINFKGCTFEEVLKDICLLSGKAQPIQVAKLRAKDTIEISLTSLEDAKLLTETKSFSTSGGGEWTASLWFTSKFDVQLLRVPAWMSNEVTRRLLGAGFCC